MVLEICSGIGDAIKMRTFHKLLLLALLTLIHDVFPLNTSAQVTSYTEIQATQQSSALRGIVLNANTKQPLGRALVQTEGLSTLTGHDGRFAFSGLSGKTAVVRVTKPGFYEGQNPYQAELKSVSIGSPDETQIKLYPEGVITGTLSAPNGDPLPRISVQAVRHIEDESVSRWIISGQTITDVDGEFRLPLPGGEYVITTQFSPERVSLHGAILPIAFPAAGGNGGATGGASTLHLASGSEQHLELHPPVRPSHTVHIQIDSAGSPSAGQNEPQIQAHLANGMMFSPVTRAAEKTGEIAISLPIGSYLLSATTPGREDGASYGETRITVGDEDVTGATIHLQKALELTIDATADPAATAAESDPGSPSFPQQLGVYLQRTDSGVSHGGETVALTSRGGAAAGFSLLPGRYRLRRSGYSAWFIESANAGGTDLLTEDLVVDSGGSSMPLRLVVNNQSATIKGKTRLGEGLIESWIYFIAAAPSALPVVSAKSGADGSFTRTLLPPGSYRTIASETRLYLNLADPAVQEQFALFMKTVTVRARETASVLLEVMPASELTP